MKRLVLAALLLADPRAVHAGSCGGNGGGGSSSGGSSSGGSSSSSGGGSGGAVVSASEGSSTSACIDDTDVLGFRHCTKFGVWGTAMRMPRLFIELGSNVRNFDSGLAHQTASVSHGDEQFSYRVVMPTAGAAHDVALTTTLRVGVGITRGFYTGIDAELGGLVAPASASTEMTTTPGTFGTPNVSQTNGLVLGAAAMAGYRVRGSRGALALEGAGGIRSVRYNFESTYHLCETSTTIVSTRPIAEARVRAELWLSPWITAGVALGSNVLDRNDWVAGLYLGAHSRAFAGGR